MAFFEPTLKIDVLKLDVATSSLAIAKDFLPFRFVNPPETLLQSVQLTQEFKAAKQSTNSRTARLTELHQRQEEAERDYIDKIIALQKKAVVKFLNIEAEVRAITAIIREDQEREARITELKNEHARKQQEIEAQKRMEQMSHAFHMMAAKRGMGRLMQPDATTAMFGAQLFQPFAPMPKLEAVPTVPPLRLEPSLFPRPTPKAPKAPKRGKAVVVSSPQVSIVDDEAMETSESDLRKEERRANRANLREERQSDSRSTSPKARNVGLLAQIGGMGFDETMRRV